MLKRLTAAGFCALLLLCSLGTTVPASAPRDGGAAAVDSVRETPVVKAIRKASPSVVNIYTEKTAASGEALFTGAKPRKVNGMGTGIVVDERGYIVTNHHVVLGVDSLRVQLADGSTYLGETVSVDRTHDLAIIRIHASRPLAVMPLGTSSDIMLGETVIAIGNAFGYDHTITLGIVSALSRDVEVNEEQSYENLIQTDASINPGNSGGPLVNLEGDVIGINVAIRAGAQRIGFAIPIDDARRIIAGLLNVEQLERTTHGIVAADVKAGPERRLVVSNVRPDSPAQHAGLQSGDVIVAAENVTVVDGVDLERAMLGHAAGETVRLTVRRSGRVETVPLTLGASRVVAQQPPADAVVRANNDEGPVEPTWDVLGLRLSKLAAGDRALAGSRYRGGMRVLQVRSGSVAASSGIRTNDVLVGLHVWETISPENIRYVLSHPQLGTFNPLKFYIIRGQETLYGHLQMAARSE